MFGFPSVVCWPQARHNMLVGRCAGAVLLLCVVARKREREDRRDPLPPPRARSLHKLLQAPPQPVVSALVLAHCQRGPSLQHGSLPLGLLKTQTVPGARPSRRSAVSWRKCPDTAVDIVCSHLHWAAERGRGWPLPSRLPVNPDSVSSPCSVLF